MNREIKKEIEEYVLREFKHLEDLDSQDEECTSVRDSSIKNINILVDLLQKEDVNNNNLHLENRKIDEAEMKNNSDTEIKKKELNIKSKIDIELRSDRIIKILVDGATIIVPVVFYNLWMDRGFEFEKTGTFCSNTFKNMFSKFKLGK